MVLRVLPGAWAPGAAAQSVARRPAPHTRPQWRQRPACTAPQPLRAQKHGQDRAASAHDAGPLPADEASALFDELADRAGGDRCVTLGRYPEGSGWRACQAIHDEHLLFRVPAAMCLSQDLPGCVPPPPSFTARQADPERWEFPLAAALACMCLMGSSSNRSSGGYHFRNVAPAAQSFWARYARLLPLRVETLLSFSEAELCELQVRCPIMHALHNSSKPHRSACGMHC
jgi:hypothetical protein